MKAKKYLSVVLSFALILGLLPGAALAAAKEPAVRTSAVYADGEGNVSTTSTAKVDVKSVLDPEQVYTISMDVQPANSGTLTIRPKPASVGQTVYLYTDPAFGYERAEITVDGAELNGNSFVMPESNVAVEVVFEAKSRGTVNVQVTDAKNDGAAIDNTTVRLHSYSSPIIAVDETTSEIVYDYDMSVSTGVGGVYTFSNVPYGHYWVGVEDKAYESGRGSYSDVSVESATTSVSLSVTSAGDMSLEFEGKDENGETSVYYRDSYTVSGASAKSVSAGETVKLTLELYNRTLTSLTVGGMALNATLTGTEYRGSGSYGDEVNTYEASFVASSDFATTSSSDASSVITVEGVFQRSQYEVSVSGVSSSVSYTLDIADNNDPSFENVQSYSNESALAYADQHARLTLTVPKGSTLLGVAWNGEARNIDDFPKTVNDDGSVSYEITKYSIPGKNSEFAVTVAEKIEGIGAVVAPTDNPVAKIEVEKVTTLSGVSGDALTQIQKEVTPDAVQSALENDTSYKDPLAQASSSLLASVTSGRVADVQSAVTKLKEANSSLTLTEDDIRLITVPYLSVQVEGASAAGDEVTSLSFSVSAKAAVFVTKDANIARNYTVKEILEEHGKEAVPVVQDADLAIDRQINLTLPVPASLAAKAEDGLLYVGHEHDGKSYEYDAFVNDDNTIRFTSEKGLSSFTVSPVSKKVAEIGSLGYLDFAEAVEDAINGHSDLRVYEPALGSGYVVSKAVSGLRFRSDTLTGAQMANLLSAGGGYEKTTTTNEKTTTFGYNEVIFKFALPSETSEETTTTTTTPTVSYSRGGGGGGGGSSTPTIINTPTAPVSTASGVSNGSVSISNSNAVAGDTVVLTPSANAGYHLESLTVTNASGGQVEVTKNEDGTYSFTMPSSNVTINPVFVRDEVSAGSFSDVPADAYYGDAVTWAVERGITNGVGDNQFAPDASCTRAQVVTFLWRAAGSPEPSGSVSFDDVADTGSYYYKAVAWAVENGITNGMGDNQFAPDAIVNRAQVVTFLYRYEKAAADADSTFSDVDSSAWYAPAVSWAVDKGVTNGMGNNSFAPENDCTRGQIVTFLYRDMAQ